MYIPPSQYTTGFYSNGEYSFLDKRPYIGPYFTLLNGNTFTGKTPTQSSKQIFQLLNNEDSLSQNINSLTNVAPNQIIQPLISTPFSRIVPPLFSPPPFPKDFKNSFIFRYFVKKTNEYLYYETDDLSYNGITSRKKEYAWDLYDAVKIQWIIKGNRPLVYKYNKTQVTNIESIYSGRNLNGKNWMGFSQYFKDNYLKYYLES